MNIDELYRHQYGLLVASLCKKFGFNCFELVEDAVQFSLEQAIREWNREAQPDNSTAWLYKVAYRHILRELSADKRKHALLLMESLESDFELVHTDNFFYKGELTDSFLKVLFITCDEKIPIESQLVFTLKSLCGFTVEALAQRLFTSEANVYKRYQRAKTFLSSNYSQYDNYSELKLQARLESVLKVLYLMFTEGYLSSHPEQAIRKDLCKEAQRIMLLLVNSKLGSKPLCYALLALMYLNLARFNARENESGLVLLELQDRQQWDSICIQKGFYFLDKSAQGDTISRYHLEAGIAAQHCMSKSFADTNWKKIIASYEMLETISPSPMHLLNKAIAIAEDQGAKQALTLLEQSNQPSWLVRSYYWYAVVADLQFRCGKKDQAKSNAETAIKLATSAHIATLLKKRFSHYAD